VTNIFAVPILRKTSTKANKAKPEQVCFGLNFTQVWNSKVKKIRYFEGSTAKYERFHDAIQTVYPFSLAKNIEKVALGDPTTHSERPFTPSCACCPITTLCVPAIMWSLRSSMRCRLPTTPEALIRPKPHSSSDSFPRNQPFVRTTSEIEDGPKFLNPTAILKNIEIKTAKNFK
jgi:hypothetical protein